MLKRFLNWVFPSPRDRRANGHAWAKKELAKGRTPEDVQTNVECSKDFGDYDDFDRGIEDALKEHNDA